jgi:hypothetical protein
MKSLMLYLDPLLVTVLYGRGKPLRLVPGQNVAIVTQTSRVQLDRMCSFVSVDQDTSIETIDYIKIVNVEYVM